MDRLPAYQIKVSNKCIVPDWRVPFQGEWIGYRLYQIQKYQVNVSVPDWRSSVSKGMDRLPAVSDTKVSSKYRYDVGEVPFQGEWFGYRLYQIKSIK
ncbi:hypothetical protein AVEN_236940-1 [Araneus ventricosus]|uniref:Uncharacterized protein n=1 Tax=Araneus ventricosus TaxID=182803 RepID=A0A4Y2LHJ8_ARAVE|nr:hypothetical protein AVEN_236940-1 [Araneus ventricosus]